MRDFVTPVANPTRRRFVRKVALGVAVGEATESESSRPRRTPAYILRYMRLLCRSWILLVLVAIAGDFAYAQPPTVSESAPLLGSAAGDGAFRTTVAEFIESELRMFPETATEQGDHRFDDRITYQTQAAIAGHVGHAKEWKARFAAVDPGQLSPANEADREWLVLNLDGDLLWDEQVRSYEREPSLYLPTAAVYSLIKRNFAPLDERMRSVTAREKAALTNLGAARENLKPARVPRVAVDIVLEEAPATLSFFHDDLPAAFASISNTPEKQQFENANAALIEALKSYDQWLRTQLEPVARGDYAIGADAYRRMLKDSDAVDIPLAELDSIGVVEMARLQREFRQTAQQIDPRHSPAEVEKALTEGHPSSREVIPTVTAGLAAIRKYVVDHRIATIPPNAPPPTVIETPPYMRATTFASMDTPGPFERTGEAFFQVTLPDPSWSPEQEQQLLTFYSPVNISDTSVHEVYPGHYVQFLNNRVNPDLVRALYGSGANAEGWALYCEQMMLDEGLHNGDPRYRLAQLQMALLRACRYLVGLRMHTRGMTVEQATAFFEKNAYMNPHNARVEALRGTGDPGYLRYQLGKLMILKLRADVKKKEGARFELGSFHDAFLRQGAIPIKFIRRAMLGKDGPLL